MKRLVLFVVALVFAFCTTVMAADKPAAVGTAAPAKVADTKKVKKDKKAAKKVKKAEKAAAVGTAAPAK
jgi:sugar phosphate permease